MTVREKGLFAKSPDPVVFGPDTFFGPESLLSQYPLADWQHDIYTAYFKRADYPDWPS